MNNRKIIFIIFLTIIFISSVGLSYAYFSSTIVNKDVKDQVVQTGTLELTYTDAPEIVMNNIKPGANIAKEISVKNTGTLDASYNLVWQELVNFIANDEMVIEATCTRLNANGAEEGTCESLSSTPIKRIKIKENVSIEPSITHKYNITITFKEINDDQNYNQGKNFTGTLGINEYVENTPIYCTFDGELTQGAEYANGQYTYRYMQQLMYDSWDDENDKSIYSWDNIDEDGWGVTLTDKESTTPVTSKLCTYINNKPIVSMQYMFSESQATKADLSSFNTSNITNMSYMFKFSKIATLDLSNFDTSNVTDMSYMFDESWATAVDLNNFDTSKVINMSYMLSSSATTLDLNSFDTSNVTNMSSMFSYNQSETLDVSNFDTSKVTSMNSMFAGTKTKTLDLSNFDTSNVTDMGRMFEKSSAININLSSFNTKNVIYMFEMFLRSSIQEIDLSSFDTSNVTHMSEMFSKADKLKTIYVSEKFVTNSLKYGGNLFLNCISLVGGSGTKFNSSYIDESYARIDGGTALPGYFTLKTN